MLQVQSFVFNPLQENTYLLFDSITRECVVVDPGCYEQEERYELESFINDNKLNVTLLLNTHCHVDHVLGNYFVKERYKVKLLIHKNDEPVLKAVKVYAPNYGFFQYQETAPDGYLNEGDSITVGTESLSVLFVPGHAPGHVAFYHSNSKQLIAGDVLFYNSIGRTDLPGGHYDTLIQSIHDKIFTLPDDVVVFPGHGPETSVGFEKRTNPFCAINV
jgi:hydroxyacylglutathione hydrolase